VRAFCLCKLSITQRLTCSPVPFGFGRFADLLLKFLVVAPELFSAPPFGLE
jgi:hypothetical protein